MVNYVGIVFIFSYHLVALYGIFNVNITPLLVALTFFMYAFTGFGITMGYHRLWAHKSYTASPLLKCILAFGGAGAAQGSIIWWSRLHRLHHRKSDTPDDPYGPQKGFWYSHILWIFENRNIKALDYIDVSDLKNDKIVYFQHKYYVYISLLCSIIMPLAIYSIFDSLNYNTVMACIVYPISI
jgi:stearoyl-CoA desaturase (delta-9 desaturase)